MAARRLRAAAAVARTEDGWISLALLPGALTLYLAFNAGGYFPGETAVAATVLLLIVAARTMLASEPAAGFGRVLLVAAGALALFAVWTLLSGGWSGARARALLEFDRAVLYLVVLVLFGLVGGGAPRLRWVLRGVALAVVAVCAVSLVTRALPSVWPIDYESLTPRLSYPITYWNSLGLLAAMGVVLCFGMTADARESRVVRVLSCAAIPLLGSVLLLTLSRGSILVAVLGLVVFALVAHPRALPSAIVASGPATAIAVAYAYKSDLLLSDDPLTRAARDQGESLAVVVALCVLGACILRLLLLRVDDVAAAMRIAPHVRRRALAAGIAAVAVALAASAVAVDLPRQYDRFVNTEGVGTSASEGERARLTNSSSNGRVAQWRVAYRQFEATPIRGNGAGTYEFSWVQERPFFAILRDGHSLYLEVLSELGLVGFGFIIVAVLAILAGIAVRIRGPNRVLFATVFAVTLMWAVAAGADWHWEMPVVTLLFFALGSAALAREPTPTVSPRQPAVWQRSVAAGACCVLALLVPLRVAVSQDRLKASLNDFLTGQCAPAQAAADASLRAVGSRPQAYEVLAYCALIGGQDAEAVERMNDALRRDPDNWRLHYGLARMQALAGRDPRPAARDALRLNPREPITRDAVARFAGLQRPAHWRRAALELEILVPDV